MKEIPILFSTAMVQAILAGRKTMTRRVMKIQIRPCDHSKHTDAPWKDKPTQWSEDALRTVGKAYCGMCGNGVEYSKDYGGIVCPYGKPGDVLWVRESWRGIPQDFGPDRIEFKASEVIDIRGKWKPSIHMKKEVARIWLRVTDVRVERLQDITEEDAIAEGVESKETKLGPSYIDYETGYCNGLFDAKRCLQSLWQKINGAESWNANPWVWVISFEVLSTTGKPSNLTEKSNA